MSKRSTSFNSNWLELDEFKPWLEKGINTRTARCSVCRQSFDVSNMGKSAVVSHAKGKKHLEKINSKNSMSTLFFKNSGELKKVIVTTPPAEAACTNSHKSCSQTNNLTSLLLKSTVTKAEILWCLKTVLSHSSFRSCENISKLFSVMFSDSDIAKSFSLGKTKCAYFINFGIAPYFRDLLLKELKSSKYIVVSYDESLNAFLEEEQMDILVRFFNETTKLVETRYFDSTFLKRPNSANLLQKLIESLSSLSHSNVLQLSMDGPNVNLDVLKFYHQYRVENEHPMIVNIGSCGLHVLHGALQYGFKQSSWDIDKILKAMWQIFHQSPARRDLYIKETQCDTFPLPFCKTRWIEDESVAERAIQLWGNVVKIIKYWQSLSKSTRIINLMIFLFRFTWTLS